MNQPSVRTALGQRIEAVLVILNAMPRPELSALEIVREAKVSSETICPTLTRMQELGWVSSRWDPRPRQGTYARFRLYKLTEAGIRSANAVRL